MSPLPSLARGLSPALFVSHIFVPVVLPFTGNAAENVRHCFLVPLSCPWASLSTRAPNHGAAFRGVGDRASSARHKKTSFKSEETTRITTREMQSTNKFQFAFGRGLRRLLRLHHVGFCAFTLLVCVLIRLVVWVCVLAYQA